MTDVVTKKNSILLCTSSVVEVIKLFGRKSRKSRFAFKPKQQKWVLLKAIHSVAVYAKNT